MARAAVVAPAPNATLYAWLIDRERAALAAAGPLPWTPGQPAYHGSTERLQALQAGHPVDIPAGDLPPSARPDVCRWWSRVVVSPDGHLDFYEDDGSMWLQKNGL